MPHSRQGRRCEFVGLPLSVCVCVCACMCVYVCVCVRAVISFSLESIPAAGSENDSVLYLPGECSGVEQATSGDKDTWL